MAKVAIVSGVTAAMLFCGACDRQHRAPAATEVVSALTGARTFQISVPAGVGVDRAVLAANGSLLLDDRAVVSSSGGALVANAGTVTTSGGNDAVTTTVSSLASVTFRDRTRVNGNLTTAGTLTQGSGDVITGTVTQHATLTPLLTVNWTATPPGTNGGDVTVPTGTPRTLVPGAYGTVHVFGGGARLTLTPGSYFFEQLIVEPQGTVVVQHQGQPVLVYVATTLQLHGAFSDGNDPTHLLVGFGGTSAYLETPFRGTLVAPNAAVTLTTVGGTFVGGFFGKSVEVQPVATAQLAPFAHWGMFVAPVLSLTCIIEYNPSSIGAVFGYTNPLQTAINVPAGANNKFIPAVPTFVPITQFAPGTHTGVTSVPLKGASVTWQVLSASVQATRTSLPLCSGNESKVPQATRTPSSVIDPDGPGPANPSAFSRLLQPTP